MSFLNQFENLGIEKSLIQHCKIVLVLSQLGHLTLNCVNNHPKKSHSLKKLAFTEVFNLGRNNQVTLLLQYILKRIFTCLNSTYRKGERIRRKQTEQLVFYMTHFCCSTCFPRVVRTKTHPKAELKRAKKPFTHMDGRKFLSCRKKLALAAS